MQEQKFQLEFERFKQKASWESKIFYTIILFLLGIIGFYIRDGKMNESSFSWWLIGLSLFLIVIESLVNCYLDKQKEQILDKI